MTSSIINHGIQRTEGCNSLVLCSNQPGFSSATPTTNSLFTQSQFNGNNQRACAGVEYEELLPGQLTQAAQSDCTIRDRYIENVVLKL